MCHLNLLSTLRGIHSTFNVAACMTSLANVLACWWLPWDDSNLWPKDWTGLPRNDGPYLSSALNLPFHLSHGAPPPTAPPLRISGKPLFFRAQHSFPHQWATSFPPLDWLVERTGLEDNHGIPHSLNQLVSHWIPRGIWAAFLTSAKSYAVQSIATDPTELFT